MGKKDKKKDAEKQEAKKKRQAEKATKAAKKVRSFPRVCLALACNCFRAMQ